jgi:cell division protein YceG involved in septum cleavage
VKKIFVNKKLTCLLVAMALVILLLLLMLLMSLTQIASIDAKAKQFVELKNGVDNEIISQQELINYYNSNEYLLKWAVERGLLPSDAVGWVEK